MKTKLDRILAAKLPRDYLVVKVDKDNIVDVLALEAIAVAASKNNLMGYKNIILVTSDKLVAVGTIRNIREYNPKVYSRVFFKKNVTKPWNSTVNFSDTLIIGWNMKDVFGDNTRLMHVQTFMWFNNSQELKALEDALNTSFLFNIHNTLSNLGIIQN